MCFTGNWNFYLKPSQVIQCHVCDMRSSWAKTHVKHIFVDCTDGATPHQSYQFIICGWVNDYLNSVMKLIMSTILCVLSNKRLQ